MKNQTDLDVFSLHDYISAVLVISVFVLFFISLALSIKLSGYYFWFIDLRKLHLSTCRFKPLTKQNVAVFHQ